MFKLFNQKNYFLPEKWIWVHKQILMSYEWDVSLILLELNQFLIKCCLSVLR